MAARPADDFTTDLKAQAAAIAGVGAASEVRVAATIKSPPPYVRTVRDLIYWEYSKLIARAAHRDDNYGFIVSRYKKLKDGSLQWSDRTSDTLKQMSRDRKCEYCGASGIPLANDHIIPLVKGGPDVPDNIVLACQHCNSSKGDHDIFEWYFVAQGKQQIPKLVFSKYLKMVWDFHVAHGTIDRSDINHDGKLDVLDLGAIFKRYEEKR